MKYTYMKNNIAMRKLVLSVVLLLTIVPVVTFGQDAGGSVKSEQVYKGIWCFTFGVPDAITPVSTREIGPNLDGLKSTKDIADCPIAPTSEFSDDGILIHLPLQKDELIYGLGLQFQSFQQRGSKKMLRVNADPEINTGDSHAPVPFYVTTQGYGVFVDNARYMTYYLGNKKKKTDKVDSELLSKESNDGWNSINNPYKRQKLGEESEVIVRIPMAKGVKVYIFGGPSMIDAVARYNLFSGGGVIPPKWGLGFWYRVNSNSTQEQLIALADDFRKREIPCDVLGLEPHWQTHSYSSSYVWSDKFPDPAGMLSELSKKNFRVNMWQQAFVHPKSPIYNDLKPWSGDYLVWDGLVPDFITDEAKKIYRDYNRKTSVDIGISGFKADECDNSDFTGNWSFPEISKFPSGANGEQMHSLFGLRFQDAVLSIFNEKQQRTYCLVRNSGALAAPYPFVLYSDLYNHQTFINAIAQSGFSGLLWTPEVRDAASKEDLIRRLQSTVFSPLAMINGWYLTSPPWKQLNRQLNAQNKFDENWEETESICRDMIKLRMQLIPYIHAAFVKYQKEGIPPFRALILDYPDDKNLQNLNSQYMMGDQMMVAPVTAGEKEKTIYFPEGIWYDFFTGEKIEGGQKLKIAVPLDRIPVFVKEGSLIPLAKPTLSTEDPASRELSMHIYGSKSCAFTLYEDDGSFVPSLKEVPFSWDASRNKGKKGSSVSYKVSDWKVMTSE
jgi:alpha-D-xyloside xylohydrolase